MNLILLTQQDFLTPTRVRLMDRRFDHIVKILRSGVGDQLTVGLINAKMGSGIVKQLTIDSVELDIALTIDPPKPLPLTLIMSMVRPPMFRRMLFHATILGIKKIYVLNFARVEKSFWTSSSLQAQEIQDQLVLGLEQSKDTVMPTVEIRERFKPFVEDELLIIAKDTSKLVAHPGGSGWLQKTEQLTTLIIGPEGGLVDFELKCLGDLGFMSIDLGPRILRVETALPFVVGRLFGSFR